MIDKILNWYFSKNALPYWCILILDCLICFLSGLLVFWLFFRGSQTLANIVPVSRTLGLYIVVNVVMFRLFRTYSGIIRYSSFVDLQRVGYAMAAACGVVVLLHYPILSYPQVFKPLFVPLGTRHILSIYIVSTVAMWGIRVLVKSLYDVAFSSDKGMRAMIYGVKDGGIGLAKSLRNEKPSRFQLKGFIANEVGYAGRILMGTRVYEGDESIVSVLKDLHIQAVLVSPMQNEAFRSDEVLQDWLISAGVRIYMMQSPEKWIPGQTFGSHALKEVNVEDLLPRNEIQVDMKAIGELLTGKKILITGSAGSIGSEMVRQIAKYEPAELILVDQAETPQHDLRLELAHDYPQIKSHTLMASIANAERMERIFKTYRPDYVFHAAAYKHVPMMEDNPSESIQNNVYGTKVVADLSVKYGVKKFVMISTDKAVNPTNVMGCSKRICEIYVQALNNSLPEKSCQFVTTRFGNVLGSNGSVIPLFEQQIKEGGPVTVTDPNIIRYFMLIPEACKLVLEAGTHGNGGEIFVFDMGKPVKIADLAKRMIKLSGAKDVEIKYTGLRAGEKLYEEMLSNEEDTLPSFHEKIRIAKVREYEYGEVSQQIYELIATAQTFDDMAIVAKMKEIVPEFISKNSVYTQLDKEG
ncbi:MAG: polysaccharide biosynthesis protein [Prevotella sp.]|nr:polysaccharide biosynthesis protein [Prevotella sp.]